jgi:hypothetical protein
MPQETQDYVRVITGFPVETWTAPLAGGPAIKVQQGAPCQETAGLLAWDGPDEIPMPVSSPRVVEAKAAAAAAAAAAREAKAKKHAKAAEKKKQETKQDAKQDGAKKPETKAQGVKDEGTKTQETKPDVKEPEKKEQERKDPNRNGQGTKDNNAAVTQGAQGTQAADVARR